MGQKPSRSDPSDGNFDRRAAHRLSKGKMKKDDIQLGASSIHQMEATLPMPPESEVDEKFSKMVEELGLSQALMHDLTTEKKWMIYCSRMQDIASGPPTSNAEHYIQAVSDISQRLSQGTTEEADSEDNIKLANDLRTDLRTQPIKFVEKFIKHKGLECLLNFLMQMNLDVRQSQLHYVIIACIKALMNNQKGRAHVLAHPVGIKIVAQSMKTHNVKIKIQVLEILGAVCLVPGGHKKVLEAMEEFHEFAVERARFQTIVLDLYGSLEDGHDPSSLQIAIMSFINALISFKAGEESLEMRMHLRYEFLMLGIEPILNKLRELNIGQLNKHLSIFDLVRGDDEREMATRLGIPDIEPNVIDSVASALIHRTKYSPAQDYLRSALNHLCLLQG
jgi:dishevelled associated activator of morphogenesis